MTSRSRSRGSSIARPAGSRRGGASARATSPSDPVCRSDSIWVAWRGEAATPNPSRIWLIPWIELAYRMGWATSGATGPCVAAPEPGPSAVAEEAAAAAPADVATADTDETKEG